MLTSRVFGSIVISILFLNAVNAGKIIEALSSKRKEERFKAMTPQQHLDQYWIHDDAVDKAWTGFGENKHRKARSKHLDAYEEKQPHAARLEEAKKNFAIELEKAKKAQKMKPEAKSNQAVHDNK